MNTNAIFGQWIVTHVHWHKVNTVNQLLIVLITGRPTLPLMSLMIMTTHEHSEKKIIRHMYLRLHHATWPLLTALNFYINVLLFGHVPLALSSHTCTKLKTRIECNHINVTLLIVVITQYICCGINFMLVHTMCIVYKILKTFSLLLMTQLLVSRMRRWNCWTWMSWW